MQLLITCPLIFLFLLVTAAAQNFFKTCKRKTEDFCNSGTKQIRE